MALSTWDDVSQKWSDIAISDTVVVTVYGFSVDETAWSDGSYCAGMLVAEAQGLVMGTGATLLDFTFAAPLITPSFPP
jgi:hypothetical protein